mmetsp:Transcript_22692/g.56607  ORF Transcript_22692/g.56607 Transcript_22692/m.56607 type:complete len:131 (-) Transcript_22692:2570-2962(-)
MRVLHQEVGKVVLVPRQAQSQPGLQLHPPLSLHFQAKVAMEPAAAVAALAMAAMELEGGLVLAGLLPATVEFQVGEAVPHYCLRRSGECQHPDRATESGRAHPVTRVDVRHCRCGHDPNLRLVSRVEGAA